MIDPFSDAERRRTPVELRHALEKRGQIENQQAMAMYREGIVDAEYVLTTAQIPAANAILERTWKEQLENITAQLS